MEIIVSIAVLISLLTISGKNITTVLYILDHEVLFPSQSMHSHLQVGCEQVPGFYLICLYMHLPFNSHVSKPLNSKNIYTQKIKAAFILFCFIRNVQPQN